GMPAGSVTDDTEQALIVAQLLLDGDGSVEPRSFAHALISWEEDMVARGSRDLLGPSTKAAISALQSGASPEEAGRNGTTNGAAMRVAPVGIAHPPGAGLIDAVVSASQVTHHTGLGSEATGHATALHAPYATTASDVLEGRYRWESAAAGVGRLRWVVRYVPGGGDGGTIDGAGEPRRTGSRADRATHRRCTSNCREGPRPRSTGARPGPGGRGNSVTSPPRSRRRCCVPRSRSERPATMSRTSRGSSSATRLTFVGRRWSASSPGR